MIYSFYLINSLGDTLISEGTNPFANNGQGALQSFGEPFWTTYSAMPFCGDLCIPTIIGCMDSTALNYNPDANTPDTCIAIVSGCTNPLAFNYNALANTPDTCVPYTYGCTDPTMFNYDSIANTDDGSCELDCEYLLTEQSYIDLNYDNSISNYYCNYYVSNGTYTIEQAESLSYNFSLDHNFNETNYDEISSTFKIKFLNSISCLCKFLSYSKYSSKTSIN